MSLFDSARFQISAAKLSGLPTELEPEIAFAGRSNAGKSTTINVLTRQTRLAFASRTPGRTQLVNFFELSRKIDGGRNRVVVGRLVISRATVLQKPMRPCAALGLILLAATLPDVGSFAVW